MIYALLVWKPAILAALFWLNDQSPGSDWTDELIGAIIHRLNVVISDNSHHFSRN
jgi:hypothetical protein